jgi:hypothetical protein
LETSAQSASIEAIERKLPTTRETHRDGSHNQAIQLMFATTLRLRDLPDSVESEASDWPLPAALMDIETAPR